MSVDESDLAGVDITKGNLQCPEAAFARARRTTDVVGVVTDGTTAGHPFVGINCFFPCIDDSCSCITEVQAAAVGIEGLARFGRQSLERLEARNDEGRLHIATYRHHIVETAAFQIAHGFNLGTHARDAGI